MKYFYHLVFKVLFLLYLTQNVYAIVPLEGWYVGLIGTLSKTSTFKLQFINPFTGLETTGTGKYLLGIGGGGQLGYRYCKFRFEGEITYNANNVSSFQFGNLSLNRPKKQPIATAITQKTSTNLTSAFINAYYELYNEDNEPTVFPYLGLGLGYSYINNKVNIYLPPYNFLYYKANGRKNTWLGQLILGVNFMATDEFMIGLDYRYMSTENKTFNTNGVGVPTPNKIRLQLNTINAVLNYSFEPDFI